MKEKLEIKPKDGEGLSIKELVRRRMSTRSKKVSSLFFN